MKKCAIICVSITLLLVQCLNCDPVVEIEGSKIIGENILFEDTVVYQFLSVPYAEPPVGYLRFKKPEQIQGYPDVLHAKNLPPNCPQYSNKPFPYISNSPDKNESCLYVNIWTPYDATPRNTKAVLYWIYGGGFRHGSIRLPVYSGIPLAALGDVIVVTVNYRVGPFGFLTSGTQDAPGNIGLWDILEGLKWVNKYIPYFGGDTSRITIAGQSAGAWAVGLLAVSPLSKGLFQRQIMESGSPVFLGADNNTRNIDLSQKIAEIVGCASPTFTIMENPGAVVECLRGVNSTVLAHADYTLEPTLLETFIYQYGDDIIPENPRLEILRGNFGCTELLIGSNHDEGSLLLATQVIDFFGFFGEKNPLFNKSVGAGFIRKFFKDFPDPEAVVQYYLPNYLPEHPSVTIRNQTYASLGDMILLCPTVYHAEKCAQKGGKVYSYYFTHRPKKSPFAPWMGVIHFDEVPFAFGSPLLRPSNYTEEEQAISRQVIEIWSSFVKDGKPSIPWPLYNREVPLVKLLGPGIVTGEDGIGPHRDNCDFFRPFIAPD